MLSIKQNKLWVLCVLCLANLCVESVKADLLAWYTFDDGTFHDSANGFHGRGVGNAAVVNDPERGMVLSLDGDDDWVDINIPAAVTSDNEITIALWTYVNADISQAEFVGGVNSDSWTTGAVHLKFANGKVNLGVNGPIRDDAVGKTTMPAQTWVHIAGTVDKSGMTRVYYNGVEEGSYNVGGIVTVVLDAANIGSYNTLREQNGMIDEVAIFDQALDHTEIEHVFKHGPSKWIDSIIKKYSLTVKQAKALIKEKKLQEAITLIEKQIPDYLSWINKNQTEIGILHYYLLSDMWCLAAEAKKLSGVSVPEVISTYQKALQYPTNPCHIVPCLTWMYTVTSKREYENFIKNNIRPELLAPNPTQLVNDFIVNDNWAMFESFLNIIVTKKIDPIALAQSIEQGLQGNEKYAKRFWKYCLTKPELNEYVLLCLEERAQEQIMQEQFAKAEKTYHDFLQRCHSHDQIAYYTLKQYRCYFAEGQYSRVISELETFIQQLNPAKKNIIDSARLLQGHSYLGTGQYDRALKAFRSLPSENPSGRETAEAAFYIGYCHIKLNQLDKARETLTNVVKKFPESSYVNKARLCLARIH